VLCVVIYGPLRRADHSSRGVILNVACLIECNLEILIKRAWLKRTIESQKKPRFVINFMVNYLLCYVIIHCVIYVRTLINNLCNKIKEITNVKVTSLQTASQNSDMFRYTFITFREFSVLLILNNCLEMIKIDRNMSEF